MEYQICSKGKLYCVLPGSIGFQQFIVHSEVRAIIAIIIGTTHALEESGRTGSMTTACVGATLVFRMNINKYDAVLTNFSGIE